MGRRKIEIRAIKDDRNRSVTFLKRKGGLFKKAHELSVLCSVDVAVIIFGHNKKLYQFSSGDIKETLHRYQFYGPPHEHKGPSDFKNKGSAGDDDDEEDEEEEDNGMGREDSVPPQLPSHHPMMPPQLQHHPNSFPHVRRSGPSNSPPMNSGMFSHGRNNSNPQPPHIVSRQSSENETRRPSQPIVPLQHPRATPTPPPNGYAYTPNPPIYNSQANTAPPQPSPQPSYQTFPPHQQLHQQQPPPPPPPPHQQPHPQSHTQQHQSSHPSSHPPSLSQSHLQPPQQTQQPPQHYTPEPRTHTPPQPVPRVSPPPLHNEFRQPEVTPQPIKASKSHSIFTPIDEDGSVLAQHFFGAPDPPRRPDGIKNEHSPEIKRSARAAPMLPTSRSTPPHPRPTSSLHKEFRPPARSDTNSSSKSGGRPKLNLTIPSEAEDGESTSNSPGPRSAVNSANPVRPNNGNGEHHNLILPPPSPSASAVLSAGASGPPNPFARPPPPTSQNNNAYNENRSNNLETPISALPSRYMDPDLLASPGGIFGWSNFGGNGAILPSPNVNTPMPERSLHGPLRDGKREADESLNGDGKRIKT